MRHGRVGENENARGLLWDRGLKVLALLDTMALGVASLQSPYPPPCE